MHCLRIPVHELAHNSVCISTNRHHRAPTKSAFKPSTTSQHSLHAAIAHTRWATHGEPSARNSHPIGSSPSNHFTVVHNGIITNFGKLRSFLEEEGCTFDTDTDTEVIPKLCAFLHANSDAKPAFSQLVMDVLRYLEGAYAVLVQSSHYPGELVCCRRGSPVVFAVRNSKGAHLRRFRTSVDLEGDCFAGEPLECFIASDDKAIIEHAPVRVHSYTCGHTGRAAVCALRCISTTPTHCLHEPLQALSTPA